MADLFPPLFGEDHQDQDADTTKYEDATNYFGSSTSIDDQHNEQNVNDKGGIEGNFVGFKENNDGINENFYQDDGMGENTGGVGEGVFPNDGIKENNEGQNAYPSVALEENNNGAENYDGTGEKNDGSEENNNTVVKDSDLMPVLPGSSGEGLPYAPVDFPNPGDNWSWRVGRRYTNTGFFHDRFLYPPKRLQGRSSKSFASKQSVTSYVRSNFRGTNLDAFFASFSWKIPVQVPSPTEVNEVSASAPAEDPQDAVQRVLEELREEIPLTASGRPKRQATVKKPEPVPEPVPEPEEKPAPRSSGRKRKQVVNLEEPVEEESPRSTGKNKKQKASVSSASVEKKGTRKSASASASKSQQNARYPSRRQKDGKPMPVEKEPPVPNIPEDFDNYLNSLADIITQPPVQSTQIDDLPHLAVDDMAEARSKLSSLLEMDFPSLISPKILSELTSLATRLRNDPFLNAEQLVMLKLIEEIPLYSEVFLESRQIIEQVDEKFAVHERNKLRVNSLKEEYNELKEKADQLQSQVDSSSMMVQEIDNEIARLQYQRAELLNMIENNKKAKDEVNNTQKVVANTIPGIVKEIQVANSKVPEWVVRKTNAANREAQVLAKFAPLRGFSL